MRFVIQPTTPFRSVLPFIIGGTVWGSSLTLMIVGLWTRSWYGYVFAAIYLGFATRALLMFRRGRKLTREELQRILHERARGSQGSTSR